jgi:2-octaprenyl-3-methyl-6-methoxy-1,4-benzoquinol hydroxylase
MEEFDIVVVGAGMVGAAAAIGFAKQGKTVALIEGRAPDPFTQQQAMDLRVSAISQASVDLIDDLGAWSDITKMRVTPYRRLETWEHPECRTCFDSDTLNMQQLGFIVENRVLQLGLWQQLAHYPNVTLHCPATLQQLHFRSTHNIVELSDGIRLSAKWVVGADGANSQVRQQAGIGITAWDYRQHCMLINIDTEDAQQDITWQWFTPSGPRSFLPLPGHKGSLVWYDRPERIRQLSAMTKDQLQHEIITHFPKELGAFTVEQFGSFPLTRRHAQRYYANRCVLLGDAAHTINPLAGQGVNLGFKDVATLLAEVDKLKTEWDSVQALRYYQFKRKPDNLLMQSGMDFFYTAFSNDIGPIKLARNIGLKLAQESGPLKNQILKYALGL